MTAADRQRLREARDEAKRREIAEAHGRLAAEAARIRGDWADAAPYERRKPKRRAAVPDTEEPRDAW